jgi:hypothetical protein
MAENCNQVCYSEHGSHIHFSKKHNLEDSVQCEAPIRKIWIRTQMTRENQQVIPNIPDPEDNFRSKFQLHTTGRRF